MSAPPSASCPKLATSRCCRARSRLVSSLRGRASADSVSCRRRFAWLRDSQEPEHRDAEEGEGAEAAVDEVAADADREHHEGGDGDDADHRRQPTADR